MKGKDVQVGDDLLFLGTAHRITDIEPLDSIQYPDGWRIAYARRPDQLKLTARNRGDVWGITLEPDADHYEVSRAGGQQAAGGKAAGSYHDAAVHLYGYLKNAGAAIPGDWNGGDTVEAVCEWLRFNGVDPDESEGADDE